MTVQYRYVASLGAYFGLFAVLAPLLGTDTALQVTALFAIVSAAIIWHSEVALAATIMLSGVAWQLSVSSQVVSVALVLLVAGCVILRSIRESRGKRRLETEASKYCASGALLVLGLYLIAHHDMVFGTLLVLCGTLVPFARAQLRGASHWMLEHTTYRKVKV